MRRLLSLFAIGFMVSLSPVYAVPNFDKLLEPEIRAVSDSVIVVKLSNMVLKKPEEELKPDMILVSSRKDSAFANGKSPACFGYWTMPLRYSIRKDLNVKGIWIFIFLDGKMVAGSDYSVQIKDAEFEKINPETGNREKSGKVKAPELSFVFKGDETRSEAIHANQAGYLPDSAKFAYLCQYAGWKNGVKDNAIDVDFSECKKFFLLDAGSGAEAFSGEIKLSPVCDKDGKSVSDRLAECRVWEMDFSSFKKPGKYRIAVPGVGSSCDFTIASNAYDSAFGNMMRGIYHQRCGTALLPEFTRHTHPACHLDDAVVPPVEAYKNEEADFYPQEAGKKIPCARGHHDAGDYGKYMTSGALFAFNLLFPFEVFPEKLQFDASPIPEAGNGIPDIIEEVKWELDWISRMQDDDGLVFSIVKPDPTMSYEDSVAGTPTKKFDKPRSLWWKDIHTTAAFAAILSRAARSPEFQKHYPEDAKIYLEKAKKAWDVCMKHTGKDGAPNDLVGGHHYGAFLNALDEYCWMAVELWLSTGEAKYHDYFLKHHKPESGWQWGWWPLKDSSGAATRSYVYGKREGKNPEMLENCRNNLVKAAENAVKWQKGWAMRASFAEDPYRFGRWGWIFLPDIASYSIVTAIPLLDEARKKEFADAVIFNADQEMGNNPENMSYITGTGLRRPVDHVHQLSRFDKISEPIPGMPLGFHPCGFNRGNSARQLMASYSAGGIPPAYRYIDCWNVEQEFTVPILASTAIVYAWLSDPSKQKSGKPSLEIRGNGAGELVSGIEPFTVKFTASAKGANGKEIKEFYWDLDNEDFSSEKDFEYTFHTPGIYKVCCTATDDSGWIDYKYITVKVAQKEKDLPNGGKAPEPAKSIRHIWNFDEGLDDSISGRQAKLGGTAKAGDANLMWMIKPSGKALELKSCDDQVIVDFDSNILTDPKIRRFRAEAIVNYEKDIERGLGHSNIILIEASYNSVLGIKKDMWNGKGLKGTNDPVIQTKALKLFDTKPGWRTIAIGFDKDAGTAYLESAGENCEFPFKFDGSGVKSTLSIGGFEGYLDELRISIEERE